MPDLCKKKNPGKIIGGTFNLGILSSPSSGCPRSTPARPLARLREISPAQFPPVRSYRAGMCYRAFSFLFPGNKNPIKMNFSVYADETPGYARMAGPREDKPFWNEFTRLVLTGAAHARVL